MRDFIQSHNVPSALFKSLFLGSKGMSNNTSSRIRLVLVHKVSLLLSLASQCIFPVLPNPHSCDQEKTAVKVVISTFRSQQFDLLALGPSHQAIGITVPCKDLTSSLNSPSAKATQMVRVHVSVGGTGNRPPFLT